MKKLRYISEFILVWFLHFIFKCLPWRVASNLGGFIMRFIGPKLGVSQKAKRHINIAFPEKNDVEIQTILIGMWDNLGRVFGEYPHLQKIATQAATSQHRDLLHKLQADQAPVIFCGAHMANWEIQTAYFSQEGLPLHSVYRRPNNPYIAKLLSKIRHIPNTEHFEKSQSGMMQLVKKLKTGGCIGLLIDQKFNAGPESQFFGHTVRSSTAFVELAQKYDCPLYFGRTIRKNRTNFELVISDPIPTHHKDGSKKSQIELLDEYHRHLEEWITDTPDQWLWLHKRWRHV